MRFYGQNCGALQTLMPALLRGAQHPLTQSGPDVQMAAHVPPFVFTHASLMQQSSLLRQADPAAAHVAEQKPRGWQYVPDAPEMGAQQPEAQPAPLTHDVAQYAWPIVVVGSAQTPEQQAFGVDVQMVPVARQEAASVDVSSAASIGGCETSNAESTNASSANDSESTDASVASSPLDVDASLPWAASTGSAASGAASVEAEEQPTRRIKAANFRMVSHRRALSGDAQ